MGHTAVAEIIYPEMPPEALPPLGHVATQSSVVMKNAFTYADQFRAEGSMAAYDVAMMVAVEEAVKVKQELDETRTTLASLTRPQRSAIDVYLGRHLLGVNSQEAGYDSLSQWLADKDAGATDQQLLAFLDQHVREVMSQRQDPEVRNLIEEQKVTRIAQEGRAVREGWLSPRVWRSSHKILDVMVGIGDVWDTVMHGSAGYHKMHTDEIVIAQGQRTGAAGKQDVKELIKGTIGHEFDHLQFASELELPRYEEEALAEHLDLSLEFGGVDTMRHFERQGAGLGERGRYPWERAVYHAMLQWGRTKISPRLATLAYSSGSKENSEWRELDSQIDASWNTHNMRARIAVAVSSYEAEARHANPEATIWEIQDKALEATYKLLSKSSERLYTQSRAAAFAYVAP